MWWLCRGICPPVSLCVSAPPAAPSVVPATPDPAAVSRPAAVPPMSSLPAATRPRRSGSRIVLWALKSAAALRFRDHPRPAPVHRAKRCRAAAQRETVSALARAVAPDDASPIVPPAASTQPGGTSLSAPMKGIQHTGWHRRRLRPLRIGACSCVCRNEPAAPGGNVVHDVQTADHDGYRAHNPRHPRSRTSDSAAPNSLCNSRICRTWSTDPGGQRLSTYCADVA